MVMLPTVSIGASTDLPTDGGTPTGVSLAASYEFDFWGRNRSLLTAAQASNRATRADRETVALTAVATTATTYFQLLSLRERLEIARLNLENAEAVLMVTDARVRNGAASPLELAQQRQTIAGQQAQIPQLEQQELETRAALATVAAKYIHRIMRRAGSRCMVCSLLLRQQSRTCAPGGRNCLVDVETLIREYGIAAGVARVFDRERVGRPIGVQLHTESVRG